MARLIRTANRSFFPSSSSCSSSSPNAISSFLFQSRPHSTNKIAKSLFDSNVLRVLSKEIEYQFEYAPPHQAATRFDSFTVQDHPGEQWMTMRGRFNDDEDIKLEATMFDGYERVAKAGDYDISAAEQLRLHITVLVDIHKKDGTDALEFMCSAWPDCLEIQKIYLLGHNKMTSRPYMGPNFRDLNGGVQKAFRKYLEERGVNDKLCVFLHEYMMNKDRIELIRWIGKVKSFMETQRQ